eukprot:TRINITY_DN5790_c0_g1_i1.p1 TRINITY_DN5790_c0_g1~~TRINITY_DN5790_c0_g1_i1.p1  ORF type:complete len:178 (-),score=9.62 TRINITY_DN5790_c0_g1_i1:54-587(-)
MAHRKMDYLKELSAFLRKPDLTWREYLYSVTSGSDMVYFFHAHLYFNHEIPSDVEAVKNFRELIIDTFKDNKHIEVHTFVPFVAGPHPCGSFEVLFTRDSFTTFVIWMQSHRPKECISILIHPISRFQLADHTYYSIWIGQQLKLKTELLIEADKGVESPDLTEEQVSKYYHTLMDH